MARHGGPLSSTSPRKRKNQGDAAHTPGKNATPGRGAAGLTRSPMQDSPAARRAGAACTAGPSSSAAAPANVEMWQRCCGVLREAVVDAGSAAAGLVPLRPSLRRIKDDLVRVLDEAVTSTNGNASLLVLGPQGTGKTLVVERALQEVCARHNSALAAASTSATAAATTTAAPPSDAPSTSSAPAPANASAASVAASVRNVGVVRLNGLLQPDERTAFQEVARQLCRDFGQRFVKSASFDENLVFLKGMLHALYKCLKKVVFVVDEFQQYAKKGKQQMLYYLLDMLQDSKIQAAVIGISAAHNVAEDLEKRVLSRVGRRRVVVTFPAREEDVVGGAAPGGSGSPGGSAAMRSPGGSATPATAAAGAGAAATAATDSYEGLLHDMLALHPGMAGLALAQQQPGAATAAAAAAATTEEHNAGLVAALRNPSVKKAVDKLEVIGSPPQHLALVAEAALVAWGADLAAAARAAGTRDAAAVPFSASHLLAGLRGVVDAPERAMVEAVSGLPVLALVLLVAAHRLQRKGQPMCNFEMVWDEYRSIQGQRGAIAFTKEAAAAAWQALPLCGLAHYSDAHLETRGRDLSYAGVVLLLGSAELEEGLRLHPHCPDAVTRFHMQEI